jgi:hypothetical protein
LGRVRLTEFHDLVEGQFGKVRATSMLVDHVLSMVLFVAMLLEFIMVQRAATDTFFVLLLLSLVDVIGGFTITIRTAQRDLAVEGIDRVGSAG